MCKFLLRRGAKINAQNLVGNTALHYCYAYHHPELGEYLKSRVSWSCVSHFCFNVLHREQMILS